MTMYGGVLCTIPSPSASTTIEQWADVSMAFQTNKMTSALNTPPTSSAELSEILSTLDPTSSGIVPYSHFLAVAALKLHARSTSRDDEDEEVEAAFTLFTRGEGDGISLAHLRRVAKELREDVPDSTLRDMIREANGSQGNVVGREEFERVMRRAGVFG